jgi:transcription initiation factor TFIIB
VITDYVDVKVCSRCGSRNLIRDTKVGEEVCSECGLVVTEEIVNPGPEWRAFSMEERTTRARTGTAASYTYYDMGMSTNFIGNRDGRGKQLDHKTINKMRMLRLYDNRSKVEDTWGRNLKIAMVELERLSSGLHIPDPVKEQGALIYRRALKRDLIRGRSIEAFVAASIYAACRMRRLPRLLRTVSKLSTREQKEISRTYRLLVRELGLKMPIDDPIKYVSGIASNLEVKPQTEFIAVNILRRAAERQGLTGKDPRGMAAASIYMACREAGERRIQKEVARAAGTSEVTLRNRLRGLEEILPERVSWDEAAAITVRD